MEFINVIMNNSEITVAHEEDKINLCYIVSTIAADRPGDASRLGP